MRDTFEYIDTSIATLALIHHGSIGVSCSTCSKDFQKDNNCLFSNKLSEIDNEKEVFYSPELDLTYSMCPISSIPNILYTLYDNWKFIEEFKPNYNMDNTPAILWYFIKQYKYASNKIEYYNMEQQNKKAKR